MQQQRGGLLGPPTPAAQINRRPIFSVNKTVAPVVSAVVEEDEEETSPKTVETFIATGKFTDEAMIEKLLQDTLLAMKNVKYPLTAQPDINQRPQVYLSLYGEYNRVDNVLKKYGFSDAQIGAAFEEVTEYYVLKDDDNMDIYNNKEQIEKFIKAAVRIRNNLLLKINRPKSDKPRKKSTFNHRIPVKGLSWIPDDKLDIMVHTFKPRPPTLPFEYDDQDKELVKRAAELDDEYERSVRDNFDIDRFGRFAIKEGFTTEEIGYAEVLYWDPTFRSKTFSNMMQDRPYEYTWGEKTIIRWNWEKVLIKSMITFRQDFMRGGGVYEYPIKPAEDFKKRRMALASEHRQSGTETYTDTQLLNGKEIGIVFFDVTSTKKNLNTTTTTTFASKKLKETIDLSTESCLHCLKEVTPQ